MAISSAAAATMETRQPAATPSTPRFTTSSPALTMTPPANTRTTSTRRGATTALFGGAGRTPTPTLSDDGEDGSQDRSSSGRALPVRQRGIGSMILEPDSQRRENTETLSEETESWTLCFRLIGAPSEKDICEISKVKKDDVTFGNLLTLKSRLGYNMRDFLYYKKRSGNNVATLHEIETESDLSVMMTNNDEERILRLVLSKDRITERNVSITPIKKPPGTTVDEDEFITVSLDDYKDWLAELHAERKGLELQDTFRIDTIKAYSEWLRHEGQLDDIEAYEELQGTLSSQSSNPTPPRQRPSHARRDKELVNNWQSGSGKRKFKGRGHLKGFTASNKRARQGTTKLDVEFSRMQGPVGGNRRSFVDEVVLFTRRKAPLIGVRWWKNIDDEVKEDIADAVMKKWDLANTLENKKKIWAIANERYRGWRSTFSSTCKAYDTYDERMRHKPEELNIVEWHYLVLYFTSVEFQERSNQNSQNRSCVQAVHSVGSKSFGQCSYELETARRKIAEKETESPDSFIPLVERNLLFQEAYKQTTRSKSSKLHGNGYMARYPSRRQLLTERLENQACSEMASHMETEELKDTLEKVQEQLKNQVAEREAEKEEHWRQMEELQKARQADKEELRKEFMSMLAAQTQGASPQVNQAAIETTTNEIVGNETVGDEAAGNEIASSTHQPILNEREGTTQDNETPLPQEINLQVKQKASTPAGNIGRNTRGSLMRSQSQNKEGNVTPNFISPKHLLDSAARKRSARKN
ncbi:uncharacterized protein LOC110436271 isoform X2 [Sorghum bicolor]|uniref:uncharacterized protein LOC110436271 isoform X2 n=1 Tax=Sorghum bicolor TaxID=4558 RepID=UPI000B4239B1|nr:uncharacterized protein LOC110436271 isoform X2 [Sorghum bicolor]|eukprot:XP_021318525.1 uncharacterized protein LOC110436271 isoform X2 [Sorghum bicolor]